jgi:hypothetical protein
MAFLPNEANSPLVVDAYRMLSLPCASQGFETITRWHAKVFKAFRVVEQTKLSQCDGLDIRRKPAATPAFPDRRRFGIAKANDHRKAI